MPPIKKHERHDITRVLEFAKMFTEKYGEYDALYAYCRLTEST